jgi:hypothetical protein
MCLLLLPARHIMVCLGFADKEGIIVYRRLMLIIVVL